MKSGWFLLLLAGMGLVTYLPRWLPLLSLSRRDLPGWLREWLDLLPTAILSALLAPALLTAGAPRHLDATRPEMLVAVPTLLFAWKTRSLAATVVVGMGLYWLAGRFL